ncbi:patatin-like phospholipase family protein [Clostridium sp. DSM 100503]|uniref:patatin-like phospholipase family protein n=1 Tax=Clostridium sp. DSM 100503 TaxID=2963282 RepID=UPI002149C72F|nr:patatin-like phospholipase family protein [Clostridium sp. DSM 100503]MCR1949466.1 patatin-like phospholipase family protein [Clostridium sp. DSM 100503]
MSNLLEDFKIGLVLSGGGAKGSYEAGVFKTLWELDLIDNVKVISGTSVGSVNALLFAMNDRKIIKDSWSSITYSRFIKLQEKTRNKKISEFIKNIAHGNYESSMIEQIKNNDIGLLSQIGIENFIREYVNIDTINVHNRDIYACAYNIDKERAEYFKLNDYSNEEILNIVLASCAIPIIFSPIKIKDDRYADGGIKSPEYSKNNVDNIPITPLKNYDCDLIIVVGLSNKDNVSKEGFDKNKIIEVYPSKKIELVNGSGSLMINKSKMLDNIELGYRDSMIKLAPLIVKIIKEKCNSEKE